ncbi:Hypothetical protein GbCGDNIH2_5092 [Granulibacter bethesdensis]|uniref:Uncharacterized protein n=1 Tax=Granulibacter bethesdensis (strain ATCC BAA-1260 / CGDNIH1) TaxID=391165 RepID=A0A286M2Z9_GRABC|nr:Hypothetical protein GbCGDNIH2_5092 [Granulibacter bethesdensis]APH51739.1 Hypothetical protein GbCGDNIH5_5092 [Granulibacter bethesdensis]APH64431.1 Hypothetical protein GbCGDNIH1I4_5092 [Granulibacter bethesdensis]ASV62398.1 Hypothetical protein GbCGDNIH1_5092 [Granulibacter bethesdensis CGDNIH1]
MMNRSIVGHHSGGSLSQVISITHRRDDTLWAVIASVGRRRRIAEIFPSRDAALQDRDWRIQQVRSYTGFLRSCRQPLPSYTVAPIRRADLPKAWRPVPALGFLRGEFI